MYILISIFHRLIHHSTHIEDDDYDDKQVLIISLDVACFFCMTDYWWLRWRVRSTYTGHSEFWSLSLSVRCAPFTSSWTYKAHHPNDRFRLGYILGTLMYLAAIPYLKNYSTSQVKSSSVRRNPCEWNGILWRYFGFSISSRGNLIPEGKKKPPRKIH